MQRVVRPLLITSALVLLAAVPVCAAPDDDHRAGLQAYHRGDVVGALQALRPAAEAGHAPSQALLAFLLERADETDAAARWYRAAAAQGDVHGHAGLAQLLASGRGVAKDENAALAAFSKAAALGHRSSIETVATAWIQGRLGADAARQPAVAAQAIRRAAEGGHLPSAEALARAHREGLYGLPVDAAEAQRWTSLADGWRQERAGTKAASR